LQEEDENPLLLDDETFLQVTKQKNIAALKEKS